MIWNKLLGEFIDVIEWTDDSNDTLVYRFERHGNEIKYGAQLTVRESQVAVFVSQGRIADVFEPGMYTLGTQNMPIFTTLESWPHGFQSPFKAEVYFVNTRRFTDLKWGTKHPITLRDKEFGPVRLRAFGTYVIRIKDPVVFLKEIVGTDGYFTVDEVSDQLRNLIASDFARVIGEASIPVLDLAANYDDLGTFLTNAMTSAFAQYGLELTRLLIENISLPPAVEAALDKRTSMGVIGDLRQYSQFQAAEAMAAAAANPSGTAAAGVGMGMGIGMAKQMTEAMGAGAAASSTAPATPPPLPGGQTYFVAIDGKQAGPFDMNTLRGHAASGTLTRDTLVWSQGMANWIRAGDVEDLTGLFTSVPPPLPPS
ncbi:MAG: SPFH domain-containing protein [Rhodospirillales bacterium]|nr:SPFH domain-containing protein [Rhodospirillales bacterium]